MNAIDIKIKEVSKQASSGLKQSQLVLEFSGKTVNNAVVNTLRRLAYNDVPTYAFDVNSINIEKNTSMFNNDYMRLRIEQMTIPKVDIPIAYLPNKYWENVNYGDQNREKHPKDDSKLEMVINVENKTINNLNVTTNDIKLYMNDVEVKKFDQKYPHLIVQLRPNEVFKCHALAVLGIGQANNIWSSVGTAFFDEDEEKGTFLLTLESQGQMDEYDILYKACEIMNEKLVNIKSDLSKKFDESVTKKNRVIVKLESESHTVGSVLNEFLQQNKNIAFSGLAKKDLLINEVEIKLESVNVNPVKPFFDTIDYVIDVYMEIQKQIAKLGSKYITMKIKK